MEDLLAVLFIAVFTVGIFGFVFWFLKRNIRKTKEEWQQLAKHFDLKLSMPEGKWAWVMGKFPTIDGRINDIPFHNYMYVRGSGKHQKTYTAFALTLENNPTKTLRLYKEGFFSKVGKAFGGQDIEVGHTAFDDNYIIKSNDELFAKKALNSRIRQLFLRKLPNLRGEFSLVNDVLSYNEIIMINNESNRKKWEETIKVGVELAKEIRSLRS